MIDDIADIVDIAADIGEIVLEIISSRNAVQRRGRASGLSGKSCNIHLGNLLCQNGEPLLFAVYYNMGGFFCHAENGNAAGQHKVSRGCDSCRNRRLRLETPGGITYNREKDGNEEGTDLWRRRPGFT